MTGREPAFPGVEYYDEKPFTSYPGMTLRDWFAGQALVGILSGRMSSHAETCVDQAYHLADLMITKRSKA